MPAGGLKLMVGTWMLKTGVRAGVAAKQRHELLKKTRPLTRVVEMVLMGAIQLTLTVFDCRVTVPTVRVAWTWSVPWLAPT